MGEYEFRTDHDKNRLYIRLGGFFKEGEVGGVLEDLEEALRETRPDFDVVTDLSRFVPASPGATEALKKAGELVMTRGRRHAVRVTGGLITGLMQFKRMLQGLSTEETVQYAKSVAEADALLDAKNASP